MPAEFMSMIVLIIMFVIMYFVLIVPQKKKEKKLKEMRENVQVGDEIVTNGGIVGIVIGVKDDTVLVETGGDRNKIRLKKWAIATVETIHE